MNLDLTECYKILDLTPGASDEEIKRAYRILVRVWHPDRLGNDLALQKHGQEKLKQINSAYKNLCLRERNQTAHQRPPETSPVKTTPFESSSSAPPSSNPKTDHGQNDKDLDTKKSSPYNDSHRKSRGEINPKTYHICVFIAIAMAIIFVIAVLSRAEP